MNQYINNQTIVDGLKPVTVNGFRENESGNLIKEDNIRLQDLERDQMVFDIASEAAELSDALSVFRQRVESKVQIYLENLFETYNKKMGGKKGNLTLYTFDKKIKIERSKQDRETTNEHILVTKQLVDECVKSWSKGANKNLQSLIRKYFRTDGAGNYNVAELKRLRKLELVHPDQNWDTAMEALDRSIEYDFTATYYRFYYRNETGSYIPIVLDIANVNTCRHVAEVTNS